MRSLVLSASLRWVAPLLLLFSVFMLLRGHNEPGGGFIGGLLAASAFCLIALSDGVAAAKSALRLSPQALLSLGLLVALASGIVAMFSGQPFMTGVWWSLPWVQGDVKVGTPILFDLGVFAAVVGGVLTMVFSIAEDTHL